MAEEQGVITATIDCGTVVQVFIETEEGTRVLAADANMFRRAQASISTPSLTGTRVTFEANDWGGLEWFAVVPNEHAVCSNCRRFIPPHLDPDACFFGQHRRKSLGNSNGAHRDEQ